MKRKHVWTRVLAAFLCMVLLGGSANLEAVGKGVEVTEEKAVEQQEKDTKENTENESTKEESEVKTEQNTVQKTLQKSSEPNGAEPVYYGWQTLEEILELCDQGLDLQEFFRYTIWNSLTREDLEELAEMGETLDSWYTQMPVAYSLGDTKVAGFSGAVSSELGNIPALGNGSHGPILKIHLSGTTAFCAQFGAACRTGMVYTSVSPAGIGIDSGKERLIKGLLAQYQQAQEVYTGPVNYIMTQAGIWLVQNDGWTGDPDGMAQAVAPLFTKTPDCPSVSFAAAYFRAIVEWLDLPENQARIDAVTLEAWANGPNQYLVTAGGNTGSPDTPSVYTHVELEKRDAQSGNIIADDAVFTVYEWNGSSYAASSIRMYRDGEKYISDDLFWTAQNQGKFRIEETTAPANGTTTGYYGDFAGGVKRQYDVQVKEDAMGEVISLTNQGNQFVNVRATGSISIYKTDIEANAYLSGDTSHGIAKLDGAIYDLYAKEDIVHPDGVTGVLYAKDSLVASGTISKGSCSFSNLYLGTYYVKERQKGETLEDGKKLSYAKGYLLDETIYEVRLPYEGETVSNVHRDVYSRKEQVIKAKAVIEKAESAAGQGTISYLAGAGFTIYRIDRLSKAETFVKQADGSYEEDSILEAYLVENYNQDVPKYDFSGETDAIATLYIRDTALREDTAHYWKDGKADLDQGKLISLGNHRYRVAELFSDSNGQVVTPYLPYGQYLVVETTVPEDHFMAPPFVLTLCNGKTTEVLTRGITEDTPYGQNLLKSGGDTTESYEAVYFSKLVDNEAVEQLLKIYKKDADTKKTVLLADTKFRIARISEETGEKTYLTHTSYYPETVNRDVFATNGQGYLQLPELLPVGLYQIEEIEGPNGFYNEVPGGYVQFRVTTDRQYESLLGSPEGSTLEGVLGERDVLLILEDYENRETRGRLTIQKRGEVLVDYKETQLLEKARAVLGLTSRKQFVYEEQPLAGATYTIRAAEDIVTQDRQLDENGNRTLWFSKGEIVVVITTGEAGQVDAIQVPTAEWPQGHSIVQVSHDGSLGSVTVDLPLGTYVIEETQAPYGYTRWEESCLVTFTWEHQFQEVVFNSAPIEETETLSYQGETGTLTVTNARVKAVPDADTKVPGIGVYKTAKENGQPLAGITFGLYTVDDIYSKEGRLLLQAGTLLETSVTDETGNAVFSQDVPIGEEAGEGKKNTGVYEIRELTTPSGVLLDTTPVQLTFSYPDDRTEYVVLQGQVKNATSEVFISKRDAANGAELKGASLKVTENWSRKVVQAWVSDGTDHEIRGLAVNPFVEDAVYSYTLTETATPKGYRTAESISFLLVEETDGDGTLKNSVYVYKKDSGTWEKAEHQTVVMKDAAKGKKKTETKSDSGKKEETPQLLTAPLTGDSAKTKWYLLLLAGALLGLLLGLFSKVKRK